MKLHCFLGRRRLINNRMLINPDLTLYIYILIFIYLNKIYIYIYIYIYIKIIVNY